MGLFSPKVNDPYNTMGTVPQRRRATPAGNVTGCEFCSTKGYVIGTTGDKDADGVKVPLGPGSRQVRRGVWEIPCPKCNGNGYFTGRGTR